MASGVGLETQVAVLVYRIMEGLLAHESRDPQTFDSLRIPSA